MNKFSTNVLQGLINKFYRSKLFKGGSSRNLKVELKLSDKELSTYTGRDAFKYIQENDSELAALEMDKYIFVHRDRDGRLQSVELNTASVDKIIKLIGVDDRYKVLSNLQRILEDSKSVGFVADFIRDEVDYITEKYSWHKSYYENDVELISILKILNAMESQSEEIMERDFSIRVLGDSKAFTFFRSKVISIVKKFDGALAVEDDATDEEILLNYNIVKNSTYALVKGNLNFRLNDQTIQLKKLGFEYSLSDIMIKQIELLPSKFNKLITVENLTSFYKTNDKDAVVIFLSGFHNHTKQLLIKKIYDNYIIENFMHTGDMDAGGFIIYNNLVQSTGIPFKPYKMGIEEFKCNINSAKPLTENDRKRLLSLLNDNNYSLFFDVINFMLENNLKLEQEIFDK